MQEGILMKSKSKDLKKPVPAKKVTLRRVLNKNKKIKKNVKYAASELTSINEVLNQGIKVDIPLQTIEEAITLNEDVEHKVARAADDLHQVNIELAKEVDERVVIESELADTKTALAKVRDDLSKSQAKEEETRKFTSKDALTGLPNRVLFVQHLDQGLIQAKRHGWGLAVLFIDLDKFKSINDSYGHDLGDKALLMVANRLQSFIREEDTVSRWGGDEFMCLLLEVKQEADVTRLAEKMVNRIAVACEFNGIVLSIRASIGIAIYPADGDTADILIKNADTAMFKAKGTEKRVALFRESAFD
jgi:diguanylate cyclase (GGDEF)-like protein